MPRLVDGVALGREFADTIWFTSPPRPVQQVLLGLLSPLARVTGHWRMSAEYHGAPTLADVEPGNRIAEVTLRLATPDGQSTAGTLEAVRNQNYSEAMRLEPFAVRVVEYPGVDSARLVVTREPAGVAPD